MIKQILYENIFRDRYWKLIFKYLNEDINTTYSTSDIVEIYKEDHSSLDDGWVAYIMYGKFKDNTHFIITAILDHGGGWGTRYIGASITIDIKTVLDNEICLFYTDNKINYGKILERALCKTTV